MICTKDILFHILYNDNIQLLNCLLKDVFSRLNVKWNLTQIAYEKQVIIFLLLLDVDIVLKNQVLEGNTKLGLDPLQPQKAETFFLSFREEIIQPWLCNEKQRNQIFLEKTRALYWSC